MRLSNSIRSFLRIGLCGCSQIAAVYFSTEIAVTHRASFFWAETGVAMLFKLFTPDKRCVEIYLQLMTGIVAYYIVRRKKNSMFLLLNTCMSNAPSQFVGYKSLKYYFPVLNDSSFGSLHFLGALFLRPVVFASAVAAIPGSYGFHLLAGVPLNTIVVNYFIGHATGTATTLYTLVSLSLFCGERFPLFRHGGSSLRSRPLESSLCPSHSTMH